MQNKTKQKILDTVHAISAIKIKEVIWSFKSNTEELVEMALSTFLMNSEGWLSGRLMMLKEKLPEAETADLFYKKIRHSL